ncbi:MAG: tRNA uridine-5-carboxymethylaminomethyl(34) synthesis GTPase MnmE [Gemmatimonadota bacterium]|nr:tRNA uridine-5-carboxymethylaminomethyl(34) synthesis GTPase MnmE [Gemmatimonadota bacterium]
MSGRQAREVAQRVLPTWKAEPRMATLAELRDPDTNALVDRAIVTWYAAPRSYTGEEIVELSVHGGAVVPALALGALFAGGARQALPGEFTRRAVAHGKMDMLQAEAVGDLVNARSVAMHEAAIGQLEGALSARITALRSVIIELEALLAYDIDFPEEDDGPVDATRIVTTVTGLLEALEMLLATATTGEMVRDGAVVVLAGAPNVGKSSLFNALIGSARAIVTDVPGTTRDAIEAVIDIARWPVRLIDTAGLRETGDVVERLGVELSEQWIARAALILACGDSPPTIAAVLAATADSTARVLTVHTKADLVTNSSYSQSTPLPIRPGKLVSDSYYLSTVTGEGLARLVEAIAQNLASAGGRNAPEVPMLTRERHRRAIMLARDEITEFQHAWREKKLPAPVAAVHLRTAAGALEELIGVVDVEDVLDRLFSTFCVGK